MNVVEIKRKPGRPRAFDLEAAVGAAARLFWDQGFEGTSITDLTTAMGISAQSLYSAFGSKRELFDLGLDWYATDISASSAEEPDDALDAVAQIMRSAAILFSRSDRPAGCMVSAGELAVGTADRAVRSELSAVRARRRQRIVDRLDRGVRAGQIGPDTDIVALARFVTAVVAGMSVQARDGATRRDLAAAADIASISLERYRA